ncbi:hypothetical protein BVRB_7g180760 [Beta vulgaris subsp. vulgaris]|uniref:Rab-GAP TBC domain-containing protein n=1 Tax=Beta vulgaris subsp. vulgaris TaxID=3555 RepID=A0A0J8BA72_BETVV|nr:hypothetical protein BVRB_7g180760 [Beta vulgaris subsp. vulgaris]
MLLSLLSRRTLEADSRDSYGFAVRPQHLQRYKEYGNIYKEEEEERSKKWWNFLEQFTKSSLSCTPVAKNSEAQEENDLSGTDEVIRHKPDGYVSDGRKLAASDSGTKWRHEQALHLSKESKHRPIRSWGPVRPALEPIEKMMSVRAMNLAYEHVRPVQKYLPSIDEENLEVNISLNNIENWFPQSELALVERDEAHEVSSEITSQDEDKEFTDINKNEEINIDSLANAEPSLPRKEELESLVHGGVPKSLRGEVWQAFVGAQARRVESYYHKLLSSETDSGDRKNVAGVVADNSTTCAPEIWKKQIEKDLPRTFPGHPALDEEGRNSLRRILTAYALHNPCVGYCQAMNFFAGLLLLLMPEENAFWTLVGIIDDYFNGCYTQEMIESQVDQLVFEELMRERFPKLVNHLDYLGVEVAWISGPWFLSIFVNMLPWESVLRIWDVLLFEGNRVMLFRTALALMELYGPALLTTKDAGDAVTLLQSLTGSTFDSSQLVLTACMGFHSVTESRLDELRKKHRHSVLEIIEERTNGSPISKNSKSLASKLYSFKHDAQSLIKKPNTNQGFNEKIDSIGSKVNSSPDNFDEFMCGLSIDSKIDALPDLQEQVVSYFGRIYILGSA